MLKPTIDSTISMCAKNLAVPEAAIRDLDNHDMEIVRLFIWNLLNKLGHSPDDIAAAFKTSSEIITRGIEKWTKVISRYPHDPQVLSRILYSLQTA